MLIVFYLLVSVVVALNGRNRQCGFWGALVLCLLGTPVIAWGILWMTAPRMERKPVIVPKASTADTSTSASS